MNRIAEPPGLCRHEPVMTWANELVLDLKRKLVYPFEPVTAQRLFEGKLLLDDPDNCPHADHTTAVDWIDALIVDLERGYAPTMERLNEFGRYYNDLEQCREGRVCR